MKITRRTFVQASAALAAAPFLPHVGGREEIRVGLVGCGGRGSGAALQALRADKAAVIVAMADAFGDRLDSSLANLGKAAGAQVRVADDHKFVGLDSGERLIASGVDVVLLASPPVFRPAHLRLAVEAGKHVFCEKPMAVDGPGIRSVLETVRLAKEKKVSLVSGFCWRYSAPHRETFKRLQDGAIGKILAVYTTYNTSPLNTYPRKPNWTDLDFQVRNWQHFTWLSGDHIAEQAIHSLDKMMWAMNGEVPVRATAVGGRQAREGAETGNVYDHFSVTYEFKSGVPGFHMCRQIANCSNDNSDLIIGDQGRCEITSFHDKHVITGPTPWKFKPKGDETDMYQQELDELFASIRKGEPKNDGVWMMNSTIAAVLGRMAAYTGQTITWEQAVESKETLLPAKLDPAARRPSSWRSPGGRGHGGDGGHGRCRKRRTRSPQKPRRHEEHEAARREHKMMRRREFLKRAAMGALALTAGPTALAAQDSKPRRIRKALKYGMIEGKMPVAEKFRIAKAAGFDGVEMDSPSGLDRDEVLKARDAAGVEIPGVVDSVHWTKTLGDPDAKVRAEGREALETALRDCQRFGGTSVLLVPAVVSKAISYADAWERSQAEIRKMLPLAAELKVTIAFENVWNHFLLSPLEAARYVDAFESPWVGWHFDVGNVVNYGWPDQWIRTLGKRIRKLDVKEFSRKKRDAEGLWKGFDVEIGEGDCDWPAVGKALDDVGYSGWAAAEVRGGDAARLKDVAARMDRVLGP